MALQESDLLTYPIQNNHEEMINQLLEYMMTENPPKLYIILNEGFGRAITCNKPQTVKKLLGYPTVQACQINRGFRGLEESLEMDGLDIFWQLIELLDKEKAEARDFEAVLIKAIKREDIKAVEALLSFENAVETIEDATLMFNSLLECKDHGVTIMKSMLSKGFQKIFRYYIFQHVNQDNAGVIKALIADDGYRKRLTNSAGQLCTATLPLFLIVFLLQKEAVSPTAPPDFYHRLWQASVSENRPGIMAILLEKKLIIKCQSVREGVLASFHRPEISYMQCQFFRDTVFKQSSVREKILEMIKKHSIVKAFEAYVETTVLQWIMPLEMINHMFCVCATQLLSNDEKVIARYLEYQSEGDTMMLTLRKK